MRRKITKVARFNSIEGLLGGLAIMVVLAVPFEVAGQCQLPDVSGGNCNGNNQCEPMCPVGYRIKAVGSATKCKCQQGSCALKSGITCEVGVKGRGTDGEPFPADSPPLKSQYEECVRNATTECHNNKKACVDQATANYNICMLQRDPADQARCKETLTGKIEDCDSKYNTCRGNAQIRCYSMIHAADIGEVVGSCGSIGTAPRALYDIAFGNDEKKYQKTRELLKKKFLEFVSGTSTGGEMCEQLCVEASATETFCTGTGSEPGLSSSTGDDFAPALAIGGMQ